MIDLNEVTVADCQVYLQNVCDPDQAPFLDQPVLNDHDMHDILQVCKLWVVNGKCLQRSSDEMESIPKYTALLLSTVMHSRSSDGEYIKTTTCNITS